MAAALTLCIGRHSDDNLWDEDEQVDEFSFFTCLSLKMALIMITYWWFEFRYRLTLRSLFVASFSLYRSSGFQCCWYFPSPALKVNRSLCLFLSFSFILFLSFLCSLFFPPISLVTSSLQLDTFLRKGKKGGRKKVNG